MIGTIHGDLHDIGKNLVAMMWRGANIQVFDLGTDVAPEAFRLAGMADVQILVGGASVTPEWAAEIGAHGYAPDAATAFATSTAALSGG